MTTLPCEAVKAASAERKLVEATVEHDIVGSVSRFLLRKEEAGGLLFDRDQFRFYRFSPMASEMLSEMKGSRQAEIRDSLENLELDLSSSTFQFLERMEKIGIFESGVADLEVLDLSTQNCGRALGGPLRVFLNLNDNCNLACKHCFLDADGDGAIMAQETAFQLLRDLREMGVVQLTISGGEPFMCPYIMDFLSYAASLRIFITISSNGLLLTETRIERLQSLKTHIRYINISIDGPRDVNDAIRGERTYSRAVTAHRRLLEADIPSTINVAVTSGLAGRENDFVTSLLADGINRVVFSPLKPIGRVLDHRELMLSAKEALSVKSRLSDLAKKAGMRVFSSSNPTDEPSIQDFIPAKYCGAGWFALSITAEGKVYPCTFLQKYFEDHGIEPENIYQTSIKQIWKQGMAFKNIRDPEQKSILQGPWCPAIKRLDLAH